MRSVLVLAVCALMVGCALPEPAPQRSGPASLQLVPPGYYSSRLRTFPANRPNRPMVVERERRERRPASVERERRPASVEREAPRWGIEERIEDAQASIDAARRELRGE